MGVRATGATPKEVGQRKLPADRADILSEFRRNGKIDNALTTLTVSHTGCVIKALQSRLFVETRRCYNVYVSLWYTLQQILHLYTYNVIVLRQSINASRYCVSVGGFSITGGSQSRARSRRSGQNKNRQQRRLPGHVFDRICCFDVLHHRTVHRQQIRSASDQNRHALQSSDVSVMSAGPVDTIHVKKRP